MPKGKKRPPGPRRGQGLAAVKAFMRKAKDAGATRGEMYRHYRVVGAPRGALLRAALDEIFGRR